MAVSIGEDQRAKERKYISLRFFTAIKRIKKTSGILKYENLNLGKNVQLRPFCKDIHLLRSEDLIIDMLRSVTVVVTLIEKDHLGDWSPEKDCC